MSEIEDERALRVRALVGNWFWFLVVALVVVAALSGWLVYSTHVNPGTHVEEQVESTWTTEATFGHEATVVESNPIFEEGSTLEDRAVYYTNIAPTVNGTYAFSYGSTTGGDLTVQTQVVLQLRSVSEGDGETGNGEQTVYWEQTEPLSSRTVSGVEPGESVQTTFSLNTTQVDQRLDSIESALGGTAGSVEVRLVAQSDFEGTVDGESIDDRRIHQIPLSISGGTYSFGDESPWVKEYERTQEVRVENEYGIGRRIGAPAMLLLSLVGLALLAFVYSRGLQELTPAERRALTFYRNRSAYDEWITRATLPKDAIEDDPARVATLEDLVDLAIDTDERVIEDPRRNAYIVRHEGAHYVYSPPVKIETQSGTSDEEPL